MSGYLVNFGVYIMAMTGLIFFALMVYKKFSQFGSPKALNTKLLSVEETISIAPRKTLYVVKAGTERFLIAGDIDKTTLIAKLNETPSRDDFSTVNDPEKFADLNRQDKNFHKMNSTLNLKSDRDEIIRTRTNYENIQEKIRAKRSSGIDDLPVIVNFPNRPQSKTANVLHNMVKKINE